MPDKSKAGAPLYVLYAAKSTTDLNDSLGSQLDEMREHIEENGGGEIVGQGSDENVSGYKKSRGPGLAKMQTLAADTAAAHPDRDVVLLAFDPDRLARGDSKQAKHLVQRTLEANDGGYRLVTVTKGELTGDEGLTKSAMLGDRANMDSVAKGAHVRRGKKKSARNGKRAGGRRPFGYVIEFVGFEKDENGRERKVTRLAPHPTEAAVVVRIFEWVAAGLAQSWIARELNGEGIKTVTGVSWKQTRISQMIRNPIYVGKLATTYGVFDGQHDAIVSPDLWARVEQLRVARGPHQGRGRPPKGNRHLLPGTLLRCGLCGAAMVPRTEPTRDVYRCSGRLQGHTICDMQPVLRETVDSAVRDYFFARAFDLEGTRSRFAEAQARGREETAALLADAEREALAVEAHRKRVESDYRSGGLPAGLYAEEREDLAAREASTRAAVERLESRLSEVAARTPLADAEGDLLEYLAQVQRAEGNDELRAALLRLFERLDLFPANMTRRLPRGGDQPVDRLMNAGYTIEPYVRPGVVVGWYEEDDGTAQWLMPVLAPTPLGKGETKSAPVR